MMATGYWCALRSRGARVGEHEERVGLDLTMHREAAYTVID